jgi:hypothetical protein
MERRLSVQGGEELLCILKSFWIGSVVGGRQGGSFDG